MHRYRIHTIVVTLALATATAPGATVRIFLSETGTVDGTITGDALSPALDADPPLKPGTQRFWVWVQITGEDTRVNGLDFSIRASEGTNIDSYNFWNHSFLNGAFFRWNPGEVPGKAGDHGQQTGDLLFVAIQRPGVTNDAFSPFDTQHDVATTSTLIGLVNVTADGKSEPRLDIVFNRGSMAVPSTWDRTFLGLDDTVGNAGFGPYDNPSPEAGSAESMSLTSLLAAMTSALRDAEYDTELLFNLFRWLRGSDE